MMKEIKPSQLKSIVQDIVIGGKLPVMIWGASGIGKSEIINDTVKKYESNTIKKNEMKVIDLRLNYYEEADMLGIPMKGENGMEFVKYSEFPKEGKGVWFLDELTHAKTSIQGLAFQLINDKKIESYNVPEGWQYFIAASNRVSDRTISNPMPSGLANRFTGGHYVLKPDLEEWKIWASVNNISPEIIGFLSYMEDDGKDKKNRGWLFRQDSNEAFLSPRIWAKGIDFAMKFYKTAAQRRVAIEGMIGVENGNEYLQYLDSIEDMPNIQAILGGDYSWFKRKKEASMNWLFLSGLSSVVINKPENFDRAVLALINLDEEYIVYYMKMMLQADKEQFRQKFTQNTVLKKNVDRYLDLVSDFSGE